MDHGVDPLPLYPTLAKRMEVDETQLIEFFGVPPVHEDPEEKEVLTLMLEMIVEDKPLSEVAAGLNRQGLQTRFGTAWSQINVFYMLPRLIEVAPQIFSSETWRERRSVVASRLESLLG